MFRRTNPPEFSDDESKAYALLDDAKQLEDNGIVQYFELLILILSLSLLPHTLLLINLNS